MANKGGKRIEEFDPEFRFLLDLDPALEGWCAWAAEYWTGLPRTSNSLNVRPGRLSGHLPAGGACIP